MNSDDHVSDLSFEELRLNSMSITNNSITSVSSFSRNHHASSSSSQNPPSSEKRNNVISLMAFTTSICGSEPLELVFEKCLTRSDVSKTHGRFLIPEFKVMNPEDFLTKKEDRKLRNKQDINVLVFGPQKRITRLKLGQWETRSGNNYALKKNWNHVVRVNGLKENMVLRVLSFRVHRQL